ncbi:LysR family transcriptional regulator [Defluviimonas salinarum]|uniref:LysR family transcriptional regulator n=1 Tax=Defluviimonas salinarum TaxID=2992147 RepID=A0ABT3IZZ5_9RHOB|nr:LysR family transcriptional regulator [Defluviimonas salinarum]MCW3781003.1 LysR family transcriptional regulator [Defluviimonas salinarum]
MNWDDLKYVLAVAREGTLAAAGRSLQVDPTTVGRRVLALESQLATRLFDRLTDGYRPTAAGEIAVAQAEQMEEMALSAEGRIQGHDTRVEGPVRLTALDAMIDALIVPNLPRLLAKHPGLELTLASGFDVLRLSRRDADIALRVMQPTEPDAVGIRIGPTAMSLYCAAESDFGPAPPVIGLPREREALGFMQLLARHLPESRVALRGNTEGHLIAAVRAGLGVGFIDCVVADADPRLRRWRPDIVERSTLWAVTHIDIHRAPRVRAVIDFLTELHNEKADLFDGRCPFPSC